MDSLPPDQTIDFLEQLRDSFKFFDRGNNGLISKQEFKNQLAKFSFSLSDAQLDDFFTLYAPTGYLRFAEFTRLYTSSQLDYDREHQFRQIFRLIDRNGDGFVGVDDIKYMMDTMGLPIERSELTKLFERYQGELCFSAFCKIYGKFDIECDKQE